MSILLGPDLEHRIALKVQSGRYQSPDEVIQEGLALLEARDAATQDSVPRGESRPWEAIARIARQVTNEEWARIPTDLAQNVDHYLYRSPKTSE